VRITHANKDDVHYIAHAWVKGGYNLEESMWHNPYFIKKDATPQEREACLAKYRNHIRRTKSPYHALPELAGKTLGCWCKPQSCHGDVLVELLRDYRPPPVKRPLFRMVEGSTTRAFFCLRQLRRVSYVRIGDSDSEEDDNFIDMEDGAVDEDHLKDHIEKEILNVDWQFGPLNPTFRWRWPSVDIECDLPPERKTKRAFASGSWRA
jgi:hypothetical protein